MYRSAPLALLRRRTAGVPHEIVGDEHPASLKNIQECHPATFTNERRGGVNRNHRKPPAGGRNGVALSGVSLLAKAQCVELRLEGAPIDDPGSAKFIPVEVFHRSLHGPV